MKKIFRSEKPNVRAQEKRSASICSNAEIADRYINGNEIATAAITVASQEKTIVTEKKSRKNFPTGCFTPKIDNKKKTKTVGGNTSGNVNKLLKSIFPFDCFILKTLYATKVPIKKVTNIEVIAVFNEIMIGVISIVSPTHS